jgi:hypothetical protein
MVFQQPIYFSHANSATQNHPFAAISPTRFRGVYSYSLRECGRTTRLAGSDRERARGIGAAQTAARPRTRLPNASIDARWRLSLSLSVPTLAPMIFCGLTPCSPPGGHCRRNTNLPVRCKLLIYMNNISYVASLSLRLQDVRSNIKGLELNSESRNNVARIGLAPATWGKILRLIPYSSLISIGYRINPRLPPRIELNASIDAHYEALALSVRPFAVFAAGTKWPPGGVPKNSRPPISPSPCSAGYPGRSRITATPLSF